MTEKLLLIILDGYGLNKSRIGNAIAAAKTPYLDSLFDKYPHSKLSATGKCVGLPEGIMGNSEVGHLNIGAGRIVYQLNTMIDNKIDTGDFYKNKALLSAINHAKINKSNLHLFGLLSDGGVHSSLIHLEALLKLFKREKFKDVYYHAFMDGRDTLQNSGIDFMKWFIDKTKEYDVGQVSTISGRYYAMDRDNRWERVQKAYDALAKGIGNYAIDPLKAISDSYEAGISDEFILPTIITKDDKPLATIKDNDAIIFFNFRSDRPRELTKCFIYKDFIEVQTKNISNLKYVTMTEYDVNFYPLVEVAFKAEKLDNILGKVISDNGLSQLRLAETEKYAHVTFFFNGGVEPPFDNEDRILVPSLKVSSYNLKPDMSAAKVTVKAIKALSTKKYDLIVLNYANCDMVGHTGVFDAVIKAVETVDDCLCKVIPIAKENGYHVIVTADHGNAEQMLDSAGNVMTAHSMKLVPFILLSETYKLNDGKLGDIAPTILDLMKLKTPKEMTGISLIKK